MIDLFNQKLRLRDLRKLVEPHLHEVKWECKADKSSEWIIVSLEDQKHSQRFISWLHLKNIEGSYNAILVDTAWSELKYIHWNLLYEQPKQYFYQKHILIVASDRSWIVEYAPQQEIIRFGRWVKVA